MAKLYGRLQGSSNAQVTRCGHSHIYATVETWSGILRVELEADGSFSVSMSGKHGQDRREILRGNLDAQTVERQETASTLPQDREHAAAQTVAEQLPAKIAAREFVDALADAEYLRTQLGVLSALSALGS